MNSTVQTRKRPVLAQRVAYGLLAILTLLSVVLLDVVIAKNALDTMEGAVGRLFSHGSLVPIALTLFVVLGAMEMHDLLRRKGARPLSWFAYFMIAVLMLSPWASSAGLLGSSPSQVEGLFWTMSLLIASIVGSGIFIVGRGSPSEALRDFSATVTMILYFGFLGSFTIQLRCGRDIPAQDGAWLLLLTLLIIKFSDIGAYFSGRFLGRHQLAPKLSPGKTVEGAIGGLFASMGVALFFASLSPWLASTLSSRTEGAQPQVSEWAVMLHEAVSAFTRTHTPDGLPVWLRALMLGALMSIAGQLGDLLESCFKRDAKVKDSGKLMPQFGGILDLIDSPILAVPVAWFVLAAVWGVI